MCVRVCALSAFDNWKAIHRLPEWKFIYGFSFPSASDFPTPHTHGRRRQNPGKMKNMYICVEESLVWQSPSARRLGEWNVLLIIFLCLISDRIYWHVKNTNPKGDGNRTHHWLTASATRATHRWTETISMSMHIYLEFARVSVSIFVPIYLSIHWLAYAIRTMSHDDDAIRKERTHSPTQQHNDTFYSNMICSYGEFGATSLLIKRMQRVSLAHFQGNIPLSPQPERTHRPNRFAFFNLLLKWCEFVFTMRSLQASGHRVYACLINRFSYLAWIFPSRPRSTFLWNKRVCNADEFLRSHELPIRCCRSVGKLFLFFFSVLSFHSYFIARI